MRVHPWWHLIVRAEIERQKSPILLVSHFCLLCFFGKVCLGGDFRRTSSLFNCLWSYWRDPIYSRRRFYFNRRVELCFCCFLCSLLNFRLFNWRTNWSNSWWLRGHSLTYRLFNWKLFRLSIVQRLLPLLCLLTSLLHEFQSNVLLTRLLICIFALFCLSFLLLGHCLHRRKLFIWNSLLIIN